MSDLNEKNKNDVTYIKQTERLYEKISFDFGSAFGRTWHCIRREPTHERF